MEKENKSNICELIQNYKRKNIKLRNKTKHKSRKTF